MPRARGRQALAARKLQSWMAFKGALGRCRRRCGTMVSSHPVRFRGSPQNRPAGKLMPVAAVRAGTSVDSRTGSGPSSSETRACAGLRRPIAAPSARLKGRPSPAVLFCHCYAEAHELQWRSSRSKSVTRRNRNASRFDRRILSHHRIGVQGTE
jgi:hypothetical protein